ncbi:MAG TPA: tyrosine-type recombinase/integrase [Polyangiales bacterium]|nr:tyrosine-type recombinase/integrase [Polyangiales bacterium]
MAGRLYKRGRIWWGWYYRDGKRVCASTRCCDRRAAEAVLRQWERHAVDPDYAAAHSTTLSEALGRFIVDRGNRGRADSTIDFYRSKAGHLLRLFGQELKLAHVNARRVDDYVNTRLDEGASRHTVYKELVTLRGTLKVAKRRGEFCGDIQAVMPDGFSTGYKPCERKLTIDEARRLLAQLRPDRAAHVAFMIATGARWSESGRAMRVDIDWRRGLVRLRGTKTASAERAVPVAGFSIELLEFAERHAAGVGGHLFRPWGNRHRDIKAARAAAEIASGGLLLAENSLDRATQLKHVAISPNDLRRTYATWLREDGIEPHLLAPALGHRDSRMVERVYGRLVPEALGKILRRRLRPSQQLVPHSKPVNQQCNAAAAAISDATSRPEREYRPPATFEQFRRQPEQDEWQPNDSTSAGRSGGDGTTTRMENESAGRPVAAINGPLSR